MKNNGLLLLDTGNLLYPGDARTNLVKQEIVLNAMDVMGYHALNIGPYEISPSHNFLNKICHADVFPLISANIEQTDTTTLSCIQKYIIKDINGIRIGITGILPDQKESAMVDKNFNITDPIISLKEIIPELRAKSDFIILLSQFNAKETQEIMEGFSDIDIALCVDSIPVEITNPLPLKVMSITNRGKEIGIITIEKTDSDVIIKTVRRKMLDDFVPSDPVIDAIVKDSMKKLEHQKQEARSKIAHKKRLKMLELTPEAFIRQYNRN